MPRGLEGKSLRFKVQWRGQSGGYAASAARSRLDIMQPRGSDIATRSHFVSSGPARALLRHAQLAGDSVQRDRGALQRAPPCRQRGGGVSVGGETARS